MIFVLQYVGFGPSLALKSATSLEARLGPLYVTVAQERLQKDRPIPPSVKLLDREIQRICTRI
jgi:hypothetical protein